MIVGDDWIIGTGRSLKTSVVTLFIYKKASGNIGYLTLKPLEWHNFSQLGSGTCVKWLSSATCNLVMIDWELLIFALVYVLILVVVKFWFKAGKLYVIEIVNSCSLSLLWWNLKYPSGIHLLKRLVIFGYFVMPRCEVERKKFLVLNAYSHVVS